MPRNYQQKKNNEYKMPHDIYMQMLYIVRDYDRQKLFYRQLLEDEMSDDQLVMQIAREILAVEKAADSMKEIQNFGDGFRALDAFSNYEYFSYSFAGEDRDGACKKTWQRYRNAFAYRVAKGLNKI